MIRDCFFLGCSLCNGSTKALLPKAIIMPGARVRSSHSASSQRCPENGFRCRKPTFANIMMRITLKMRKRLQVPVLRTGAFYFGIFRHEYRYYYYYCMYYYDTINTVVPLFIIILHLVLCLYLPTNSPFCCRALSCCEEQHCCNASKVPIRCPAHRGEIRPRVTPWLQIEK